MAGYVLLTIEGVLARAVKPGDWSAPIPEGIKLYDALRQRFKIALVTGVEDTVKTEHWLKHNGVREYTTVMGPVGVSNLDVDVREQQVLELRGLGHAIDLLIDSSPSVVTRVLGLGVTTLLFTSPRYARPEFRPGAKTVAREWAELAELGTVPDRPRTADIAD